MKIIQYADIDPIQFESDTIKGVKGRVIIGKNDGANNFCMRIFELLSGGHTPKHSHDWEHEIFVHDGEGEVYSNGEWKEIKRGTAIFIRANEEHQIRNSGKDNLIILCLIPSGAPEL